MAQRNAPSFNNQTYVHVDEITGLPAAPFISTGLVNSANWVWDTGTLAWVKETQPGGGGGGGGPATIADGADVAQGNTADAAYVAGSGTVVAILKGIFAKLAGTLTVGGTVAVSNFPATQPVSGTVTANAGVNLNTSALALEAGHLATIDTSTAKIPAQGQALAAACLPVVLPVAQITTLTPPAAIVGFALDATLKAGATNIAKAEDAATVTGDTGVAVLFARNDLSANVTDTNGDYTQPSVDVAGRVRTRETDQTYQTTLSGANAGVTLTIGAAGAGLFHYITSIEIVNVNPTAAAIAGSAVTLGYTSTNIPGAPAWTAGNALAAGAEKVVARNNYPGGVKTTAAATNTTIVAPAIGAGGLCRISVTYFIAP